MGVIQRLAAVAGILTSVCQPAAADPVAEFFKDRRITMYIGSSAAGGTDLYGRILAAHMGAHVPGNPQFIVSNVPGANGLTLANQLFNTMPRDGTAMATFDRYMGIQSIIGNTAAKFDSTKFNWIGSANVDVSYCVTWHTSGITTMAQFMTMDFAVGSTAPYHPNILNRIFGAKFKLVRGYPGGNEIDLAMERGELAARCHWSWSSITSLRGDWLRDKKLNVVLQFSDKPHPETTHVPLVTELVTSREQREIIDLILSSQAMARPFAAPPGLPPERVEALREAFMKTLADPAFLAAARQKSLEISAVPGAQIQDIITRVAKTPPEVIERFREQVMNN